LRELNKKVLTGLLVFGILISLPSVFAENMMNTNKEHYDEGETIVISGVIDGYANTMIELSIHNQIMSNGGYNANVLWSEKILTNGTGHFSTETTAGSNGLWVPSRQMIVETNQLAGFTLHDSFTFANFENYQPIVMDGTLPIQFENQLFDVRVSTQNLEIEQATVNPNRNSVTFNVNSLDSQSLFSVWLPTDLIDAISGQNDKDFTVFADGEEIYYVEVMYREDKLRVADVWLLGDVKQIEFVGTQLGQGEQILTESQKIAKLESQVEELQQQINQLQGSPTSSTQEQPEITYPDTKLPSWVRDLFIWYAQGLVSEDELLNAIQFLIDQGIIHTRN